MAGTEKNANPRTPKDNGKCFVCGEKNSQGLKLHFELSGEEISAPFTPDEKFQGYEGIVHGGILATVLDEAMVNLVFRLGHPAVSGELKVRFHMPAEPGFPLRVRAWIERKRGGSFSTASELKDERGNTVASATATLIRV